jgi:putative mRNA 3-end processing factor
MLLTLTKQGLYCPQADVYIDPWRAVPRAIITHAHSDHARTGNTAYLAHTQSKEVLKYRLGKKITINTLNYEQTLFVNGVKISLHPAGHIIGSAQVRLEHKGEVWVCSGDYKVIADGLTVPFAAVKCHRFITESTFGLPIYKFNKAAHDIALLQQWVLDTIAAKQNVLLIGYSLGKAQRILHAVATLGIPIVVHNNIYDCNEAVGFSNTGLIKHTIANKYIKVPCIIVVPPGSADAAWLKAYTPYATAMCSGWMQVRAWRRRSNLEKGFAISDHCDWPGLLQAIQATEAQHIYITHGYKAVLAKYVREQLHLQATELETLFEGDEANNTNTNE